MEGKAAGADASGANKNQVHPPPAAFNGAPPRKQFQVSGTVP